MRILRGAGFHQVCMNPLQTNWHRPLSVFRPDNGKYCKSGIKRSPLPSIRRFHFFFPLPLSSLSLQNEKSILIESWPPISFHLKEKFCQRKFCRRIPVPVIKNWQGQIIRNSYWNVNSYVPRSEVKNDSPSTYFIINRNVRIGRSMFHAKTTIVLQRFDYLWTLCVFVDVRVPTVYLSIPRLLNYRRFSSFLSSPFLSFFLFSLPPISITSSPCFFPLSRRGEEKNRVPFIGFQSRENALRWRIGIELQLFFSLFLSFRSMFSYYSRWRGGRAMNELFMEYRWKITSKIIRR